MKGNTFWNRRFFVGGAAVVTAASLYISAVARGALKACNHEDVDAGLSSDLQSLIRIGNSYLNEHAKNGVLDTSDEVFPDDTEMNSANIIYAIQRRLLGMDRQVRDEFARRETVTCDGWVLAKSEARLCAAIAERARRF